MHTHYITLYHYIIHVLYFYRCKPSICHMPNFVQYVRIFWFSNPAYMYMLLTLKQSWLPGVFIIYNINYMLLEKVGNRRSLGTSWEDFFLNIRFVHSNSYFHHVVIWAVKTHCLTMEMNYSVRMILIMTIIHKKSCCDFPIQQTIVILNLAILLVTANESTKLFAHIHSKYQKGYFIL